MYNINLKILGLMFNTKEFDSCINNRPNSLFAYVPEVSTIPKEHEKNCALCDGIGILKVEATGSFLACPKNKDFENILMLRYVRELVFEKDNSNRLDITISFYTDANCSNNKIGKHTYSFYQWRENERDGLFENSQRTTIIQVSELGDYCKVFVAKQGWPMDISPTPEQIDNKLKSIYFERYNKFIGNKNTVCY